MGLDHTGTHDVHFLGTFTFVVWIKCPRYIQSHEIKDIEYRYVSARYCPVKQTGPWCLINDSSISLIWLTGSAANNSEEHQSKACRTAWEVLAAKPHSETRFLGNYRDAAAYGQGGRSFAKGFLFDTLKNYFYVLNQYFILQYMECNFGGYELLKQLGCEGGGSHKDKSIGGCFSALKRGHH